MDIFHFQMATTILPKGVFIMTHDTSNPGKTMYGMAGRPPGYYCPPISKDGTYDAGGGSSDPCYTKQDPYNLDSSILDYSKYVQMEKVCTNDKAKSKQNFKPDDVDDNPMNNHKNKRKQQYQQDKQQYQHQHQHSGAINVYHHHRTSQNNQHNMQKQNNQHNMQNQNNKQGQSNSYQEPASCGVIYKGASQNVYLCIPLWRRGFQNRVDCWWFSEGRAKAHRFFS